MRCLQSCAQKYNYVILTQVSSYSFCSQLHSFLALFYSSFLRVFLKPFRVVVSLNLTVVAAGLSLLLCLFLFSSLLLFYDSPLRLSANSTKTVIYGQSYDYSPWYNRTGWLGVKRQITYLLARDFAPRNYWNTKMILVAAHLNAEIILVVTLSHGLVHRRR